MNMPQEIRVSPDRRELRLRFAESEEITLPAEMLRVLSPSAEVKGHGPGQEVTVSGKKDVTIQSISPVGRYAIRIGFSDRHDTGLFTWDYLAELHAERETRWEEYLGRLAAKGLSRG